MQKIFDYIYLLQGNGSLGKSPSVTKDDIGNPYDFKHISGLDTSGQFVDNTNDLDPKMRKKFEMSNVKNVIARPQSLMLRPKSMYKSFAMTYFSIPEFKIWTNWAN